ncbi:ComEA family DNA-binding protein [Candidatus Entotheonella palauensis]|uniref:ComEA family DNA-binding protein n=1 Tax=Candidatus Entotheonella palauensis TaxID=93172 RepID=UPI000B7E121B|nr:helix-hairpin-helix domain-containing protein [Candidatus Entotheonella palauensis]
MNSRLQRIAAVAVMLLLLVAGLAVAQGKVDVNQADVKGLMSLKGIGEQKAKAIVKYRQLHGPFQSPDDLANVPGIGKKIVTNSSCLLRDS